MLWKIIGKLLVSIPTKATPSSCVRVWPASVRTGYKLCVLDVQMQRGSIDHATPRTTTELRGRRVEMR